MTEKDSVLITVDELAALLGSGAAPTLLDVRWRLAGPPGRGLYAAGHIPGAVFADLDADLAGAHRAGETGRHPMPAAGDFQAAMRRLGVRDGGLTVVYDEADSMSAARAWWLLRYFGHRDVRVLDGGLRAWTAAGGATEAGTAAGTVPPGDFTADPGHLPLLDADGAAAVARTGVLLDARSAQRYLGEAEHIDPVAGHIPGAISAPAAANVSQDGTFLPTAVLAARFKALGVTGPGTGPGISSGGPGTGAGAGADGLTGVYCGSGVTAAHEALALALAGLPAAVYIGSWSDWITDPARPVAAGPDAG